MSGPGATVAAPRPAGGSGVGGRVSGEGSPMGAVGAGLDLPLTATFPCRASAGGRATRHAVVIAPDWSVQTPHDEGLERIAAAFGGGVSCIPALRAVLPGFRMWWERATRRPGLLARSPDRGATWFSTEGALPCCPSRGFGDAAEAAAHCRGVPHVAAATRVPWRDLRNLVAGLGPAADPGLPVGAGESLVEQAWGCGLHPSWVQGLRAELAAAGFADPTLELVIAIAHKGAAVTWVASTTRSTMDPSTAPWAAWTQTELDRREPDARSDWMATGARRADIVRLSMSGYVSAAAQAVAHDWGISVPGAAQLLARWVGSGYTPDPKQLAWVGEEGVGFPPDPPAPSAVERVARALGRRHPDTAQRTELAIALARWGTVPDTVAVLRRGGQLQFTHGAGDVGPPA